MAQRKAEEAIEDMGAKELSEGNTSDRRFETTTPELGREEEEAYLRTRKPKSISEVEGNLKEPDSVRECASKVGVS